jgi:hypothetical protein
MGVCGAFAAALCVELVSDALIGAAPVVAGLDLEELDGDLRCRTRTFGGVLGGAELAGAAARGGAPGVAAPLSGRLPAPRVVLLLWVMTSPENRPTGWASITYDGNETDRRATNVLDMTLTDLAGLATPP